MTIRKLAPVLLAALGPPGPLRRPPPRRARSTRPVSAHRLRRRGHGWGHGIGMSQWGAYGYAKAGSTYRQILAHYYTGTTIGPAPVRRVRVLLVSSSPSLVIASEADCA